MKQFLSSVVHGFYYNILIFVFVNTGGSSFYFSMKFSSYGVPNRDSCLYECILFYLQKPKLSETAVQLKQNQLYNSKFPSDKTREEQPPQGFMPIVSSLGFEWGMKVVAWLCSPTQAKKRLVFAFWIFCFFSFLFSLAINVPASMIGRGSSCKHSSLQSECSWYTVLTCEQLPGYCSIHLGRWKMGITHWTSQSDHLQKGLQCSMGME